MKNYYSENTDKGIRIYVSDKYDDYIGYDSETKSDLFATLVVIGFVIFLLVL